MAGNQNSMGVRIKKCACVHGCMLRYDGTVQELFLGLLLSVVSSCFSRTRAYRLNVAQYHAVMNRIQVAPALASDSKH